MYFLVGDVFLLEALWRFETRTTGEIALSGGEAVPLEASVEGVGKRRE